MKRHISILACLVLVVAMVCALASCDLIDKITGGKQPEHEHSFTEGKCECGAEDPNYVPPHTHNFVDGKCECGEEDPNYVPECTEHANSIEVTKEATCTEAGEKKLTCTLCGHVETLEIAPLGHTEEKVPGTAPTCTEAGLSDGKKCSVCGVTTVEQVSINAAGHSFVEGTCSVCGETDPDYNGPKTYVLDIQSMAPVAQKDKADGESELFGDFFTIYYSAKFKLDGSNKSFEDGFAATQRLNWGGGTVIGDTTKNAIKFTVDGTAIVKVWWVCGGTYDIKEGDTVVDTLPRQLGIYDENGNLVAQTNVDESSVPEGDSDGIKNNLFISELAISKAGTYYLGNVGNGNYFFNVEVVVTPIVKNEIKVETTDTYTMYNHDSFTFTAVEEGNYTFTVPAGLGILADGTAAPEIDYYDNINGGEFTIGLEAGQEVLFWISAMTKDVWTLEWTFVAGDVEPFVPVGCNHWWMPAMGHEQMVLPTCQAGGVLVQECFMCGEIKVEEVGPDTVDGHDYVLDESTYVETTCQVDGYKKETCSLCGDVKETTFDHEIYGEHDYVADEATYKEANCQEAGYAKYTCSVCGDSYEETTEADPIWGHNDVYSNNYSVITCSVCNRVVFDFNVNETETTFGISMGTSFMTGAGLISIWNADYSINEAFGFTHTLADGVYTLTLTNDYENANASGLMNATITVKVVCAGLEVTITYAEGEAVSFKNYENEHLYDEGVVTDPTCAAAGYTTYTCECGHSYKEEGAPATGEHTLGEWTVSSPAACEKAGEKIQKCTVCDSIVNTEAIEALNHDYDHITHDATCTAAGYVEHICALCDHTYTDGEIEALGHADENGDYKCDRCSTKMLPADGETLTVAQAIAVAKVAGSSYSTQKYFITGIVTNVYNTTYGNLYLKDDQGNQLCIYGLYTWDKAIRYDKMEYKPVEGDELTVYTVLGTYNSTAQGKDAWMDDVVAHEHNYVDSVTAPTCVAAGFTTHTCSICTASYTDSEVAALGHTTENGVCDNCGLTIGGDAPVIGELARFDFGANGSAAHADGNDLGSSKSYTAGSQTLSLTGMSKVYGPARDAKGNSCIKLGTSKLTGTFSFTVGEDVTEVVIYVAGYKAATSTNIKVNGTQYTVKTTSNNGEYTAITIDTTETKTITLTTVTYRCMIDAIVFNGVVA